MVDIFWETKSGLKPRIWAQRFIGALNYRGWAYQKRYDGNQIIVSELADSFFSIILDIQQDRPDITALDIDVINDYVRGSTPRF